MSVTIGTPTLICSGLRKVEHNYLVMEQSLQIKSLPAATVGNHHSHIDSLALTNGCTPAIC